ncbi:MAG: hypothetical protein WC379_17945 [Methanoregula sp.]
MLREKKASEQRSTIVTGGNAGLEAGSMERKNKTNSIRSIQSLIKIFHGHRIRAIIFR